MAWQVLSLLPCHFISSSFGNSLVPTSTFFWFIVGFHFPFLECESLESNNHPDGKLVGMGCAFNGIYSLFPFSWNFSVPLQPFWICFLAGFPVKFFF